MLQHTEAPLKQVKSWRVLQMRKKTVEIMRRTQNGNL